MRRSPLVLVLLVVAVLGDRIASGSSGSSGSSAGPSGGRLSGRVVRAVDGDTLKVAVGGRLESVRLIGIDTPESKRPGTPVQCGALAASRAMHRLADGRRVTLVFDPTQDRRDRYGRLLAYVMAGGGDVGLAQVRAGWAMVYVYEHHPFVRVARYRAAASAARRADRGVDGRCGGDFHTPA
jgi:micrococcal nuclease